MTRNDPCNIATEYAERMSTARTVIELKAIGQEIKTNITNIIGWEQWLRDWYSSRLHDLKTIKTTPKEVLSKAGLAWQKEQEAKNEQ